MSPRHTMISRHIRIPPTLAALSLALLAILCVGCGPRPAEIAGTWELEMSFDGIDRQVTLELAEDDGELKGTWNGMRGSSELLKPQLSMGQLAFDIEPETIRGPMRMRFAGRFDGDRLDGSLRTNNRDRMVVHGVRAR